jgi:hypothetical protein
VKPNFQATFVITNGVWQREKTINDVYCSLREGDVILKGANALDLLHNRAAVLVGHPEAGTVALVLQAVVGGGCG